jgi:hypothetical protein
MLGGFAGGWAWLRREERSGDDPNVFGMKSWPGQAATGRAGRPREGMGGERRQDI